MIKGIFMAAYTVQHNSTASDRGGLRMRDLTLDIASTSQQVHLTFADDLEAMTAVENMYFGLTKSGDTINTNENTEQWMCGKDKADETAAYQCFYTKFYKKNEDTNTLQTTFFTVDDIADIDIADVN